MHVEGAVNFSRPEFTDATFAGIVPARGARTLIWCNYRFASAPESLPVKAAASTLTLSTLVPPQSDGYCNVCELGSAVDVERSTLVFAAL